MIRKNQENSQSEQVLPRANSPTNYSFEVPAALCDVTSLPLVSLTSRFEFQDRVILMAAVKMRKSKYMISFRNIPKNQLQLFIALAL